MHKKADPVPSLALFPKALNKSLFIDYYREYISFLRVPIVWVTLFIFVSVQMTMVRYYAQWPATSLWMLIVFSAGTLLLTLIILFWRLAHFWGLALQIFLLDFAVFVFFSTIGWGTAIAWQSMPLVYVGIMTTIFGSILGSAASILAYSRTHYLLLNLGLMLPGIIFMLQGKTDVHIIMGLLFSSGLVSFSVINFLEHAKIRRLFDTRHELSIERENSEKLLRNILPDQIAEQLKVKGQALPRRYESATVMFTDFVGFTRIAEKLNPEQVVEELDKCFSYFDQVTERYGLEKIKTIGDSFMCVGGVPAMNSSHAIDCCLAALEIQAFMKEMKEAKKSRGLNYWELRLGIHTGPLVAGVVGQKKFAYDVWGDTVNTASRMESSGIPGEINLSAATYRAVKKWFICEHRGRLKAKNKGSLDMYFLRGIRQESSTDAAGREPKAMLKL